MMKQERLVLAGFAAAMHARSAPVLAQQVKFAADAEASGKISLHGGTNLIPDSSTYAAIRSSR
jgi:hypothetical protein